MTAQLPLALDLRPRLRLDDWVAGPNAAVLRAARAVVAGSEAQLYVSGPPGTGRTHLLLGICDAAEQAGEPVGYLPLAETPALAVALLEGMEGLALLAFDDVQAIAGRPEWEQGLFHLYNRARAAGTRLVFAADAGPAALDLALPDLRSRLAWGLSFQLGGLDDPARLEFLAREARRRGLDLPPEVARYILQHCPRDPASLQRVLARLDRAALAERRRLTASFVRERLRADPGIGD